MKPTPTKQILAHSFKTLKSVEAMSAATIRSMPEDLRKITIWPGGIHTRQTAIRFYEHEFSGLPEDGIALEQTELTELLKSYAARDEIPLRAQEPDEPGKPYTLETGTGIDLEVGPGIWQPPDSPNGLEWSDTVNAIELGAVATGASADDMRPVLTAVNVGARGAVATDSYKLLHTKATKLEPAGAEGINLPAKMLTAVSKVAQVVKIEQTTDDYRGHRKPVIVSAVIDGPTKKLTGYAKLVHATTPIDGKYPDYEQLFPKEYDTEARIKTTTAKLVKRIAKLTKRDKPIKLTPEKDDAGKVRLYAESDDARTHEKIGEVTETKLDELDPIGVNPVFLGTAIEFCTGTTPWIEFKSTTPLRPMELTNENGTRAALVMPVRIAEAEAAARNREKVAADKAARNAENWQAAREAARDA